MTMVVRVSACIALALLAGCGRPDTQALKKLACGQVASTIDLQSVGQLDALRKALGLAPGVDPIGTCRSLGVTMEARPQGQDSGQGSTGESTENRKNESNGGEN
ncbi:MAG: hypothetical protein NTV57_07645 [Cyanobacteria bacterium]|jgi:hypothetical protein|nr:hypothetical protein [Cyanobacteriota bacterium]